MDIDMEQTVRINKRDSKGNPLPLDPTVDVAMIKNIIANGELVHSSLDGLNGIPYRIKYKGYTLTPCQGEIYIRRDQSGEVYITTWSNEGIMAHRNRNEDGSCDRMVSHMRTLNGYNT